MLRESFQENLVCFTFIISEDLFLYLSGKHNLYSDSKGSEQEASRVSFRTDRNGLKLLSFKSIICNCMDGNWFVCLCNSELNKIAV